SLLRHGLSASAVEDLLETAQGGLAVTEARSNGLGRPVRVRYMRDQRDSIEALSELAVPTRAGGEVRLADIADIRYVRTAQQIRSENGRTMTFVVFDAAPDVAEVDAVEAARAALAGDIARGKLTVPPAVNYVLSGTYENHVHAMQRLRWLVPLALLIMALLI